MRLQVQTTGEVIELGDHCKLAAGGEARIFTHPAHPAEVVKVWHQPTTERAQKLAAMLNNPPVDPLAAQGHVAIAWPTSLVQTAHRQVVGFVMPRVQGVHPVIDYFNPKTRIQRSPLFNWFYLHRTARNLAAAMRALHERGYVIGDLNECNILASETALVTMVDTDSFQVWDAARGRLFRCRVGRPEFTPPELQGKSFAQINREPAHDHFGLGILIYQLLMEGTHPFAGVYHGRGEPPPIPERIGSGAFPHGNDPHTPYTPVPIAPRFEWLHPGLQNLLFRCFRDGHARPELRPDPMSWQYGLEEAEQNLVSCHDNPQHVFSNHLPACPWCERTAMLGGRDPFPSPAAVQAGEHLRPAPRPRTPLKHPSGWTRSFPGRPGPTGSSPPLPRPIPPSTGGGRPATQGGRLRTLLADLVNSWRPGNVPTTLPPSGSAADALRRAFGTAHRNDAAWISLGFGIVAAVMRLALWTGALPPEFRPLAYLPSVLAILLGLLGFLAASDWRRAGAGSRPAQIGFALGLLTCWP